MRLLIILAVLLLLLLLQPGRGSRRINCALAQGRRGSKRQQQPLIGPADSCSFDPSAALIHVSISELAVHSWRLLRAALAIA